MDTTDCLERSVSIGFFSLCFEFHSTTKRGCLGGYAFQWLLLLLIGAPEFKDKGTVELPLELCYIKMQGFSCKLVNGVSLLPSFMHRLEARLLAVQLRCMLSQSYPAAIRLSIDRVRICFAQSLVNLIPMFRPWCVSTRVGRVLEIAPDPCWVWKLITRLSKNKYPVYIYNHGSKFFWKFQRKLPCLCWVFHDIWWFFDSFFANTQTWWFFDPDFFCKYPEPAVITKMKDLHTLVSVCFAPLLFNN